MIINSVFFIFLLYFETTPNTSSGIKHIFPTLSPGFKYFIVWMFKLKEKKSSIKS